MSMKDLKRKIQARAKYNHERESARRKAHSFAQMYEYIGRQKEADAVLALVDDHEKQLERRKQEGGKTQ